VVPMTSRRTQLTAAAERPGTGVITGIAGVGIDELFFPASGQRVPLGLQFAQQLRQRPRFGGRCQCRPQGLLHAGFPAKGHESVKLVFGNTGNDDGPGKIRSHACAAPIRQGDQVGKGGLLMGFVGPEKADMVNAGHLEDTHEFILSRSGESAEQQLGGAVHPGVGVLDFFKGTVCHRSSPHATEAVLTTGRSGGPGFGPAFKDQKGLPDKCTIAFGRAGGEIGLVQAMARAFRPTRFPGPIDRPVVKVVEQRHRAGQGRAATMVEQKQAGQQVVKGRHISGQFDGRVLDKVLESFPAFFAVAAGFKRRVDMRA
jgi:hypothetical protein